ncbi:MAG: hypothetical protein ACFFDN_02575 [Candidatus Hodarchaeota archaeon]
MIIGIEGGLGSGKTIMMVRYLVKDFLKHEKKIFSNFKLKKIKYKPLDVMEILEMDEGGFNLSDISCAIDEFTVFADCRTSMRKMNRFISYFILQTRKRNVTLYYTTQDFNMVDLRIINHTDIRIVAEKILKPDGENYYEKFRKYTIYDLRDLRNLNWHSFSLNITPYFDYYDTNEVILPPL